MTETWDPLGILMPPISSSASTARFERRYFQNRLIQDIHMRTNEYGVSMPANTNLIGVKIDRIQLAMLGHHIMRQRRLSIAKPAVGFLERNNVRANFVDDRKDPFRSTQPVSTNGLADVIAGNPDHRTTLAAYSAVAKPKS